MGSHAHPADHGGSVAQAKVSYVIIASLRLAGTSRKWDQKHQGEKRYQGKLRHRRAREDVDTRVPA